jgi:L-aminopeptidase/D-esterase-like protein
LYDTITDVPGIRVGHYTDPEAVTGCTVVLCPEGAVAGIDVRGAAPGTRETDLLRPLNLVQQAHAVVLSGGSAYGLAAADGVMTWLEEQSVGFPVGVGVVPIVASAILFDLAIGDATVRPRPEHGYRASASAVSSPPTQGSVGAGTGATIGKALGQERAVKGGLGCASRQVGGYTVGALVAVNALGSIVDSETGRTIAGPRDPDGQGFLDSVDILENSTAAPAVALQNTTLAVVSTDAPLTKEQANKVAQMAHDGLAMAIRPAHTMFDGDVIFALSTGKANPVPDVTPFGAAAARALSSAIVTAITQASSLGGVPSVSELEQNLQQGES